LLLTSIFVISTFDDSIAQMFRSSVGLCYACIGISLIVGFVLICFKSVARKVPTNYILLAIWTFCESWMVATISAYYEPTTVFIAAAMTAGVTCALTAYACTTKTDFTYCGGLLFAGTCLMLLTGIFFLIFGSGSYGSKGFQVINIIYCCMGVLLYSLYLIYDTQLVMGKFGIEYNIDDYVLAAMMIYIDVIEMFLYILRMVGNRR